MKRSTASLLAPALSLLGVLATLPADAAPPTVGAMQWHRRVLLVASPDARDPKIALQARILADWKTEAADRDISLVSVVGDRVDGAADRASALRERYRIDPKGFQALLIGKDGHVAMRSDQPIAADTLQGTIDAMPMRRSGQR